MALPLMPLTPVTNATLLGLALNPNVVLMVGKKKKKSEIRQARRMLRIQRGSNLVLCLFARRRVALARIISDLQLSNFLLENCC